MEGEEAMSEEAAGPSDTGEPVCSSIARERGGVASVVVWRMVGRMRVWAVGVGRRRASSCEQ